MFGWIVPAVLVILVLVVLISNIHIVQQSRAYVIERLGAFSTVWEVGIHFKIPFIERVARRVSLKEQVLDYVRTHSMDVVVILGAGDLDNMVPEIQQILEQKTK